MSKTIVCIGGRCSSWGKTWSRHFYDGGEDCLRCGMNRKEQFEEDKLAGIVTGAYVPNTGRPRSERKVTSQQIMYCALGDYGIEMESPTKKGIQAWIDSQVEDEGVDPDYYSIVTHTKAELAAMPEV